MYTNNRRHRAVKRWMVLSLWVGIATIAGVSGYWIHQARSHRHPLLLPGSFAYGVKSEVTNPEYTPAFNNVNKTTGLPEEPSPAPAPLPMGSTSATPEPASLLLLAPGALLLTRRRARG